MESASPPATASWGPLRIQCHMADALRTVDEVAQRLRQSALGVQQVGRQHRLLTAVDSRTNPASTAGTAQHDLDLVSG